MTPAMKSRNARPVITLRRFSAGSVAGEGERGKFRKGWNEWVDGG
jgi:hypothetical protein